MFTGKQKYLWYINLNLFYILVWIWAEFDMYIVEVHIIVTMQ